VTRAAQSWLERYGLAVVALGLAGLLKLHYSRASAEELRWILAPTTALTSLVTQAQFVFRDGQGYLSHELSILISPACAGVNFLIVAFLSLALGFQTHFQGWRARVRWLVASAGAAYLVTLLISTLRIALSVALAHLAARVFGLTFQSVHRLLGILVYLSGLCALCLTVQRCLPFSSAQRSGPTAAARGLPGKRGVLLLALACYASITLVVPLLRGAYRTPEYWSHAAPVSVLVGGLAALLFAAKGRIWDDGRHEFRASEQPQPEPVAHQPAARG
jgi:exosortase K